MAICDVTVMGGGIFGLSIAYACALRGARVRVIECDRIGAGASGGLVGALAPHVPEPWNAKKQFQFESLTAAPEFWAGVARVSGHDPGYARLGRLQPLADAAAVDLARGRAKDAQRHWGGVAGWRLVADDCGWGIASASGWFLHDDLSARLNPRAALAALAAAVGALGGEVIELGGPGAAGGLRRPPAGILPDEKCHEGTGMVVWATGVAGLEDLAADLGPGFASPLAVAGVKGQAALLALAAPERPQVFVEGLHIVPHFDGTVALGSTSERDFSDGGATDAGLDVLIARARALCPALALAPVVARWAGVRPRAPSRAPVLGAWPGRPGHFIANGGFKIGFGIAPKVGAVMADLVLDGRDEVPEAFRLCAGGPSQDGG